MQVLTFRYGKENYCLRIEEVSEVLPDVAPVEMPRLPPGFAGIFQLRGKVITLFDFARSLGQPGEIDSQIVVFSEPRDHFSIRIPGVIESRELRSDPRDITGRETAVSPFLESIVYDGQEIYHLLSAAKIFSRAAEVAKSSSPMAHPGAFHNTAIEKGDIV